QKPKDEELFLKYFPTPLTVWGFSVTIPAAPIFDFTMNAAIGASFRAVFPNRVKIQMGHINWNSSIPSADVDFKFTNNGYLVGAGNIFENGAINFDLGASGSAKTRFGLSIGAAITA